ncbi:MAG: PH domain-containing protein, partial [Myxococcota bacterium]
RFGVALQICFNVPFKQIRSAALKVFESGHGDIPLTVGQAPVLGYIQLWPHVRPWRLARPEPMLRAVPDVACVGALLVDAMTDVKESENEEVKAVAVGDRSAETTPAVRPALAAVE